MTHAAYCDKQDHETITIFSVSTNNLPLGVWMCTQVCILESKRASMAWNILARFIAYSSSDRTLNAFDPLM